MTNVIQNVYPKDLTMSLASNHIEREKKLFTGAEDRIFVPDGGPFYSQSLILKDNNGVLLKPSVDYKLLYLNEEATIESGRDVVAVIWIMKETLPYVMIDYRVVGGAYGNTVNAIMQEITKAGPIQKNVDWNINVYGKPSQFPSAPHYHTPNTFTDWSMVYVQLEGIRKAIITGDDVSWESHYNYVDRRVAATEQNITATLNNYATKTYVAQAIAAVDYSVDLSGYYNKYQVDNLFTQTEAKINNISSTVGVNFYTKTESDNRYPLANDVYTKVQGDLRYMQKGDAYTKGESDGKYATQFQLNNYATTNSIAQLETRINQKITQVEQGGGTDLSGYYTKLQTYAKTEVFAKGETYSRSQTYSTTEIDNLIRGVNTNITNAVADYVPKYRIVSIADNYSVKSGDLNGDTIIRSTSVGPTRVLLPAIGTGMVIGHTVTIRQVGAGVVTIAGAAGVTISPSDSLTLRRAGITATLVYVANNSFDLITELT